MFQLADRAVVLAASDITAYLACPHLVQQTLAVARGERARPRGRPDPHAELARRRGAEHEASILERLRGDANDDVVDLGAAPVHDRGGLEAAATATAEAMHAGPRLIYQPTFFDGIWTGRADFLRRVDKPSRLGEFAYEALDAKLGRQLKPAMVHQLCLYSDFVAAIQGAAPDRAQIFLGDGSVATVVLGRFGALHRHVRRQLGRVAEEAATNTFPEPVDHCMVCEYQTECRERRVAADHLSLVAGARRDQRDHLVAIGLPTVAALADATEGSSTNGFGRQRFSLLRNQAALQVRSRTSGQPCHRQLQPARARGYAKLPEPSSGDVFFDLEGDPFARPDRGLEYLWGWWTVEDGYECAWAHDPARERAALERFVSTVRERRERHPSMHVYHYAPHESSALRRLATLHATCEEEVDDLLRRGVLVDLYAVVRQALQVGEESYSLKQLERHHGFHRLEHSVCDDGGSVVAYERWLATGGDDLLEAIRAYNEEDCRSTHQLRDWLWTRMRPEAADEFGADFRELSEPEPEEAPAPPAWLADVARLSADLTEVCGSDPEGDDDAQAERRLLSHLLLYHRREDKPSWWRYFDLRGMTPEELVDERDAIGLLELDPTVEPMPVKRSLDWTFRFPPQEFRLKPGHADDPTTGESHSVVAVADDHVVIRRSANRSAPRPGALVGGGPVNVTVLREALVDLAGSLLAEDGRFAASRSLLRREPPRLSAGDLSGEAPDELATMALALDSSVLPIQGPPGTGKTFRGARMIVRALSEGRRVGITAPSHAAIQNLLAEVEDCASVEGVAFDGIYKGSDYESEHGFVATTADNAAVTRAHHLVAGTAWLFARREHRDAFSLLFVDEAGQYALADAAAAGLSTRSLVLLGDPRQLPQVTQAAHPAASGASVLEHLLDGRATIPSGRGVLLTETWRLHPDVCAFVSERSYEGKLRSRAACAGRQVRASGALTGAGLRAVSVAHENRSQVAPEEADAIARMCRDLLDDGVMTNDRGAERCLEPRDILVVAPYNLAVHAIRQRLPVGVRVGTVDRFQGQEAPVVFFAMTCSSSDDVPRGLDFLFSPNRLNVAISRAQCLAVLVYSPRLLDANCRTVDQMALVDGACRFVELAHLQAPVP